MRGGRTRGGRRGPGTKALPPVGVIDILSVDSDGFARARPARWPEGAPRPEIRLEPDGRPGHAVGVGDRVLARLDRERSGGYLARTIRRLPAERPRTMLGIFEIVDGKGRLRPTDRRVRSAFRVARRDDKGARPGELVRAEVGPPERAGPPEARVLERLGGGEPWRTASLIAVEEHGIPERFSPAALGEARAAAAAAPGAREDLRAIPLMTIDEETARDFDDAVWAESDPDPANAGGFRLIVAIADVAWYVRPRSALDADARARGNSVYFPDRAIPMLPEALSNGWCSLEPGADRPCLAVHIRIDARGNKLGHRFARAMMRSAARQTYEGAQAAIDGDRSVALNTEIGALSAAHAALAKARDRRGALALEIPERRIRMGRDGRIAGIEFRRSLTAHRLVEEFMIAANVAAAETLEARGAPCIHRVHEAPDDARVEALRELLSTFGLRLPRGQRPRPRHFNGLLERAAATGSAELLHEAVLRTQSRAAYGIDNLGHFGLALARYCHFTSPIRRYADLVVHRALIGALKLGEGGLAHGEDHALDEIARHVSMTERRATAAERATVDRLCALYLADRVGASMPARISGITKAGLFVRLDEAGADALIPLSMLPVRPARVDPNGFRLTDGRGRTAFRLGETLAVRVLEADAATGSILCAPAAFDRKPMGRRRP